jgi:hypothetical protein
MPRRCASRSSSSASGGDSLPVGWPVTTIVSASIAAASGYDGVHRYISTPPTPPITRSRPSPHTRTSYSRGPNNSPGALSSECAVLNTCSGIARSKLWIPSKTRTAIRCMAIIYRTWAFLPLSSPGGRLDDENMLLAVLFMAGSVALLVATGWIADRLLRAEADRWARRLTEDDQDRQPL